MKGHEIRCVLFDFGGVIADEGFRNGLFEIAKLNGLDGEEFFETARELIHETGYLTGESTEGHYWDTVRRVTGIRGDDVELTRTILERFTVRKWMLDVIRWLKAKRIRLAILSDQTNWLVELEEHMKIFGLFEEVFNSYYLGKNKRDRTIFSDVTSVMRVSPGETLFVDDTEGHVQRAREMGLSAIHYTGKDSFLQELSAYFPDLPEGF